MYLVDAADRERFPESMRELNGLLSDDGLGTVPFLVLGNKVGGGERRGGGDLWGASRARSGPGRAPCTRGAAGAPAGAGGSRWACADALQRSTTPPPPPPFKDRPALRRE